MAALAAEWQKVAVASKAAAAAAIVAQEAAAAEPSLAQRIAEATAWANARSHCARQGESAGGICLQ